MTRDSSGHRSVLLYGFVATPFGKRDAESKTRKLLNDPEITVQNHIKIRPELLTMKGPPTSAPPSGGLSSTEPVPSGMGGVQAYENQGTQARQQYQQYQQQQQPTSSLMTLLPLAAMIGLGFLGGGGYVGAYPSYGYGGYGGYGYGYPYP